MLGELGTRYIKLKRYDDAEASYQAAAQLIDQITNAGTQTKAGWKAITYHHLGIVAQEQKEWMRSQSFYQQALAIKIEYDDRYGQASTFSRLGLLMPAQERWHEAARLLARGLAIFVEFEDEHYTGITINNLCNLYQAHPDETLLYEVTTVLGTTIDAVRAWVTTADSR